jgi:thioredoxin reductase (NADPH)
MEEPEGCDLTIIGGGPVGLSAGIEAKRRGLRYLILEKGVICNSIFRFPTNMVFFTTAKLLEIGGYPFPSTATKPTRMMALDYYRLIVENEELNIKTFHQVDALSGGEGDFTIAGVKLSPVSRKPQEKFIIKSKYVIIATGYFDTPIGLGDIPGEDLPHVFHYYSEPHPYYGLRVAIIGAGNSGAEASLELYRHGAEVFLFHKHSEVKPTIKYWVSPDLKNRLKNDEIHGIFSSEIYEITETGIHYKKDDSTHFLSVDAVFVLTGFRPNMKFLNFLEIEIDDDLRVKLTEEFESSRYGLFLIGSVGFGKFTNAVFIENGREHATIAVEEIEKRVKNPEYQTERKPLSLVVKQTNQ